MNGQIFQPSKSKIGDIDAKYMILIAYFGGALLSFIPGVKFAAWLVPLIIYFIDKENKFIAFHAMQSLLLTVVGFIVAVIIGIIAAVSVVSMALLNPLAVGGAVAIAAIGGIIAIVILVFAIIAAVHGYKYEIYEIKFIGPMASKFVFK